MDPVTLISRLPKSELHIHLNGAMPVEVFANLMNKYPASELMKRAPQRHVQMFESHEKIRPFLEPARWSEDEVKELFRYKDFDDFLATYCFSSYFIRDKDDLSQVMAGVIEALGAQNVVYAEISISAVEHRWNGISLEEMASCIKKAKLSGIKVNWIVDLVRDIGPGRAMELLRQIKDLRCEEIVGITIGGSEHLYPPSLFKDVYELAREEGFRLSAHAGEGLGPESVWDAVRILGAERIGHGVRAIEDASLVGYLAEHQIPLEICPTSNLMTGLYDSYESHPLEKFLDAGVPVTLNSDDPTFFSTSLVDEYVRVLERGLDLQSILGIMRNGFEHSFLAGDEIEGYLNAFERSLEELQKE